MEVASRPNAEPKTANPLRVLRNRNFARLFFAGAASMAGFAIGQVAVSWLVYAVTKSAVDVALIGVSYFLAAILFSLLAGTLVDRQERRRLMIISDVVRCAALAAATLVLYFFGFDLVLLLVLTFLLGAFTAVFQPAERALTPTLIEKEEVADANGLTQITSSLAQFVSNAAGGLLIAAVGALGALGLNSLTFLVSALLLATIAMRSKVASGTESAEKPRAGFFADAQEGFRYIAGRRALLNITLMSGILNIFFSIVAGFFVVYSSDVLKANAATYGIFLALFSLGVGPGSLIVGRVGAIKWAGKAWIWSGILQGLVIFGLVYLPQAAYAMAFLLGLLLGFGNTTWLTTIQLTVPSEVQGRYFGVDQLGSFATIPLGQILGGYAISVYGVGPTYLVSGIGMIVLSLAFGLSKDTRAWSYRAPSPLSSPSPSS